MLSTQAIFALLLAFVAGSGWLKAQLIAARYDKAKAQWEQARIAAVKEQVRAELLWSKAALDAVGRFTRVETRIVERRTEVVKNNTVFRHTPSGAVVCLDADRVRALEATRSSDDKAATAPSDGDAALR